MTPEANKGLHGWGAGAVKAALFAGAVASGVLALEVLGVVLGAVCGDGGVVTTVAAIALFLILVKLAYSRLQLVVSRILGQRVAITARPSAGAPPVAGYGTLSLEPSGRGDGTASVVFRRRNSK
jgi:hypothetical protein